MKTLFAALSITLGALCFTQCKPAAEDRVKMHENAKRISDSIARVIDSALDEVKIESASSQPANPADTTKK